MSVRWVALLPDPVTGLDSPALQAYGGPIIWHAADVQEARKLVRRDLGPNRARLASVISYVDWESRTDKQRRKFTQEPGRLMYAKRAARCWHCGGPTASRNARYCDAHRSTRNRYRRAAAADPHPPRPHAEG